MAEPSAPRVGVVGLGRLGRAVVDACGRAGLPVVMTASRGSGWRVDAEPEVIVDASSPSAHEAVRRSCLRHGAALVECVSDLDDAQWRALADLAGAVPVVRATNLAIGHHLQRTVVGLLAALGVQAAYPAETAVHERHPASKAHRPSATAVALASCWRAGSGTEVAEIGSLRAGPPVSDHEVMWSWPAETLRLRHSVRRIDAAAAGALAAVRWTRGRAPGLADMAGVFDDLLAAASSRAPARDDAARLPGGAQHPTNDLAPRSGS
ncbi:dihydrodipicolinate reductase C-terminal domain-containing protein [Streptomyces sp. V4-01]|uniref:4-hydroxy-tetrahydrodipicolinate reductase n=1 Tax=Actinacidiphila polyblastidii TaxID=3110430 RepID=A0ABU7PIE0_9ACTN|nr:dihydrodipicolinate reductase C-terminal domain-containing protein [Streptomyces sp. V4-01]